jgi:fido (protein-threonine AMPylation protein)
MPQPHEKLADSLDALRHLQEAGRRVFQSNELSRSNRQRLLKNGFVQEVMKGWLVSANPGERTGDTTPWFASFWEFCARYSDERFGDQWHLSPEQSLLLRAGHTVIPKQVIVYSPKGTNNTVNLLYGTSIYDLKQAEMPPKGDLEELDGLRVFVATAALIKVPDNFYQRYPIEAQVILSQIRDPSDLLRRLLGGGHSAVAGRLAGAFRRVGKDSIAEEIKSTMKAADFDVRESDPFEQELRFAEIRPNAAPIVGRLQALWGAHRQAVLEVFPSTPGLPKDQTTYLRAVEEVYKTDAYHSLSIEGYRVSPELIERVRSGNWNPDQLGGDQEEGNTLAARGYWQAFQLVRNDVGKVIAGADVGLIVNEGHRAWYRELFQPSVAAGIIKAEALAGYRNDAAFIRNSSHVPSRWEAVRDAMPALFDLIGREDEASVRAVLAHWLFGYIHPYPDGNGRTARFLMNVLLASGGYPWTVIRVDDRKRYMEGLEAASVGNDIRPFATFLAEQVKRAETLPGELAKSERARATAAQRA